MLNIFGPQGNFHNVVKQINDNKKLITMLSNWIFYICHVLAMVLTNPRSGKAYNSLDM